MPNAKVVVEQVVNSPLREYFAHILEVCKEPIDTLKHATLSTMESIHRNSTVQTISSRVGSLVSMALSNTFNCFAKLAAAPMFVADSQLAISEGLECLHNSKDSCVNLVSLLPDEQMKRSLTNFLAYLNKEALMSELQQCSEPVSKAVQTIIYSLENLTPDSIPEDYAKAFELIAQESQEALDCFGRLPSIHRAALSSSMMQILSPLLTPFRHIGNFAGQYPAVPVLLGVTAGAGLLYTYRNEIASGTQSSLQTVSDSFSKTVQRMKF